MTRGTPLRAALAAGSLALAAPAVVAAHGGPAADLPPLDLFTLLTAWALSPLPLVAVGVAAVLYLAAVRRVDRAHPANPVPRRRIAAWLTGLAALVIALTSSIATYAEALFSVHMAQHLLLTMVAAPLLALGAPVTLALRAARPSVRRRVLLPLLHSPPVRLLAFPVVAWLLFTAFMWAAHFSPLFDAALESAALHDLEHVLFLGTALVFWWPALAADPIPWRMGAGARILYIFLALPQNSFLGLALFLAPQALYPHYATLGRTWGPTPLEDQQLAAGLMWAGAELILLVPLLFAIRAWVGAEERRARIVDERLDREEHRLAG